MKISIINIKNLIGAAALLFVATFSNASNIELRFVEADYNTTSQELYVDIQLRNTEVGQIVLAGQNYRFYYDSEVLSLDETASESSLPSDTYGALKFENHIQNVKANHVNQLSFDDNLGFVNFAIDLTDNENGGVYVNKDEWTTVATLKFTVLEIEKRYDVVWGRKGVSDLYATAFVELGEWVGSNVIDKVNIVYYGDLTSEIETETEDARPVIQVGPNPAADFVQISFDTELKDVTTIIVRDIAGRQIKKAVAGKGAISTKIDVTDLIATTYLIEIYQSNSALMHRAQIIIAK